jgi:xylulokinase
LFEDAANVQPGANGLIVLPYFSGERTPINDPKARGVVAGLTLAHSRKHLYRAVLEGVAYGIRHNIETFQAIGAPVQRIVAVGGGTRSNTWLQIVSDVVGIEQEIPAQTIGASYGDAFLAGLATGILRRDDLNTWVKNDRIIKPDPKQQQSYSHYYENYLELYQQTRDIMHRLADDV